jgi:4-hydroxy-L-threonine phosphate dehydrogenase PdxA
MTMARHLAITMGDPAGIGPEIIVKAAAKLRDRLASSDLRLLIIGSGAALRSAQEQLGLGQPIPEVGDGEWAHLGFLQADREGEPIRPGTLSADGGRFAFKAVEQAVRLALAGRIAAIVTAPLNKEALNSAGYHYAGHTEMLAELTGVRGSVMMLAHGNMRVSHITTHVALEEVPKRLTPERLRLVIELTDKALRGLGIERRRIASRHSIRMRARAACSAARISTCPSRRLPRPWRRGSTWSGRFLAIRCSSSFAPANMMR